MDSLRYNVDEPEESILEPQFVRSDLDSVFSPGENAVLHIPQADQDLLGLSGRVRELAPVNFDGTDSTTTEERRRRFTSTSWDLKTFATTAYRDAHRLYRLRCLCCLTRQQPPARGKPRRPLISICRVRGPKFKNYLPGAYPNQRGIAGRDGKKTKPESSVRLRSRYSGGADRQSDFPAAHAASGPQPLRHWDRRPSTATSA